jgi:hypothetical protein
MLNYAKLICLKFVLIFKQFLCVRKTFIYPFAQKCLMHSVVGSKIKTKDAFKQGLSKLVISVCFLLSFSFFHPEMVLKE